MNAGDTISERFILLQKIGDGGFGDVFEVNDLKTGEKYALKYCRETEAGPIGRFKREVTILAGLQNEFVIRLLEVDLEHVPPYFVMPLAEGNIEKLALTLKGDTIGKLKVFKAICTGVDAIHRAGFYHRDINPRNALYFKDGSIVIADLGFGRNIDRKSEVHDSSKYGNGTVAYMAPEQKVSLENADHRTDIYQLGKTLQALFTGNPSALDTNLIPPGLVYIVRKATAVNPNMRYQSVADLLQELEAYMSTFDPTANPVLAFKKTNEQVKELVQKRRLTVDVCLSLIEAIDKVKKNPFSFIQLFDEIPIAALQFMTEKLDIELEQLMFCYEENLPDYRNSGNKEFEYAETIAERMKAIYYSTKNLAYKRLALKLMLQNSVWYNRYAAMNVVAEVLKSIKSDDEAVIIAQMLREEEDSYSRIYDRVESHTLHYQLEIVHNEIRDGIEEAQKAVKPSSEFPLNTDW